MTATSHAITGAAIALVIKEPILALPLAFLSHFVCDMIPHIGIKDYNERLENKRKAHTIYVIDLTLLTLFVVVLVTLGAPLIVYGCIVLAGLPDVVWAYRYFLKEKMGAVKPGPANFFTRFHQKIQWSESLRIGLVIEIIYSSVLLALIANKL